MTDDVIYDSAAEQLEQELRRQYPAIRWRVPSSLALMTDTWMYEREGFPDAVAGNRLEVQAQYGQRIAMVPVAIELVKDDLALAAKITAEAAAYAMENTAPGRAL